MSNIWAGFRVEFKGQSLRIAARWFFGNTVSLGALQIHTPVDGVHLEAFRICGGDGTNISVASSVPTKWFEKYQDVGYVNRPPAKGAGTFTPDRIEVAEIKPGQYLELVFLCADWKRSDGCIVEGTVQLFNFEHHCVGAELTYEFLA